MFIFIIYVAFTNETAVDAKVDLISLLVVYMFIFGDEE